MCPGLQNEILRPVFGIKDPKTDPRIEFVGGIRGTEELKKRVDEKGGAAFAMYPTSIYELFRVADAGASYAAENLPGLSQN